MGCSHRRSPKPRRSCHGSIHGGRVVVRRRLREISRGDWRWHRLLIPVIAPSALGPKPASCAAFTGYDAVACLSSLATRLTARCPANALTVNTSDHTICADTAGYYYCFNSLLSRQSASFGHDLLYLAFACSLIDDAHLTVTPLFTPVGRSFDPAKADLSASPIGSEPRSWEQPSTPQNHYRRRTISLERDSRQIRIHFHVQGPKSESEGPTPKLSPFRGSYLYLSEQRRLAFGNHRTGGKIALGAPKTVSKILYHLFSPLFGQMMHFSKMQ